MKAGVKEGDRIIKVSKLDLSPVLQWWQVQELSSAVAYLLLHFISNSQVVPYITGKRDEDSQLLCSQLSLFHKRQKMGLRGSTCS